MENNQQIDDIIRRALAEDLGSSGDITTLATISPIVKASADFLAKADGVLAGLQIANRVFQIIDPQLTVHWTKYEGDHIKKGEYFGRVSGSARSILVGERLALNLLQRMSGIATATAAMVQQIKKYAPTSKTQILDTRKTVPGLRYLDKLAVKAGGGSNHRFGLYDMVLIKDNHISAAGGITQAITQVQKYLTQISKNKNKTEVIPIEVEAQTLDEVREVLRVGGVDRILLDNMVKISIDKDNGSRIIDISMLREAVQIIGGKFKTEASGNVTVETVGPIASSGVDFISSGALTHSVLALDISLKIKQKL